MSGVNLNHLSDATNAYAMLVNEFAQTEFTSKEAKAVLKGSGVSFDYILSLCGASVVRTETFEVEIVSDRWDDIYTYVAPNGKKMDLAFCKAKEYATNCGGEYFKAEKKTVSAMRYYYVLNPERFNKACQETVSFYKDDVISEIERQVAKAKKTLDKLNKKLDFLNEL